MTDGLERGSAEEEVAIRARCRQRLGRERDAPALCVASVQAELLEDAEQEILEDCEPFAIGAARQREAVGPREGLEEARVLRDVDLEALARELARGDALDEGVLEAGVGQIAVAAPELRRRPAHDASPSVAPKRWT